MTYYCIDWQDCAADVGPLRDKVRRAAMSVSDLEIMVAEDMLLLRVALRQHCRSALRDTL
eukprot:m.68993 g.68993  ORF g.68993 m.68993 type:complete len:60 (-) comp7526_c0_seq1:254-433(-)